MFKKQANAKQATTLYDHLHELEMRILASALALVIAGVGVFFIFEPILDFLRAPLDAPLYYSNPAGSFAFVLKICLMGALVVAIPVIIYNMIMFVRPAFTHLLSRKKVMITSLISSLFAIIGAAFAYYAILPGSLNFFQGFQVSGLDALISADSYLNFVTNIIITFIIVFQLPLIILFIDTIKPLPPGKLLQYEKWVILGSLIVSLLVPFAYDIVTSLLISTPIVILYNLSFIAVLIRHAYVKKYAHIVLPQKLKNYSYMQEIQVTKKKAKSFAEEAKSIKAFVPKPTSVSTASAMRANVNSEGQRQNNNKDLGQRINVRKYQRFNRVSA